MSYARQMLDTSPGGLFKTPCQMLKQVCDLRRRAEGSAVAKGFE